MAIAKFSNSEFISKVIQDSDTGRSFVPLIGSGLSSPSGIIMGMEFTNYLAFVTYLVLSDPKKRERTHGEGQQSHWDLRHQGWPPLPSANEVANARKWLLQQFKEICDRYDLDINYSEDTDRIRSLTPKRSKPLSHEVLTSLVHPQVPTVLTGTDFIRPDEGVRRVSDALLSRVSNAEKTNAVAVDLLLTDVTRSNRERIVETGIRALHDWRETLVFLSSIIIRDSHLCHGTPNNSVIDRFNSFITRDKHPNLGHKMLAHLSGPLRIDAILTTNFDTLIEDAYRALHLRVRVLPVSSKGQLPDPQTVGAELAIVKLHGEVQDTRADMSLDEDPTDTDKDTFVQYLTRGAGNLRRAFPVMPKSKRLLVIGYSGADHRCVQMVKHWIESGAESTDGVHVSGGQLVYWVCFSQSDVDRVSQLFRASDYGGCVRITQSARPDLLLYELFQRLVLSLPPGGLTYEFSHVVTPRRQNPFDYDEAQIENVLSCTKSLEHPLEAARVLLSEKASLDDARRLCRDAGVIEIKRIVLDCVDGSLPFYDHNGDYAIHRQSQSVAALWSPLYREKLGELLRPRNRRDDDNALFKSFKSRPVMIDALGGVVRGVALAVEEITARTAKKVFWIETQDYMDADAMLRDLLRSIAVRSGSFQGRQVTQHPLMHSLSDDTASADWEKSAKLIGEHLGNVLVDYRIDPNQIVVLIYGRDSYGGCSGLLPSPWKVEIRSSSTKGMPSNPGCNFAAMHCVIESLGRCGITAIYFPLTSQRSLRKNQFPSASPSPSRTWSIDPRGSRKRDLAEWDACRDKNDRWREWPDDPLATKALTDPESQVRKGKIPLDHTVADGVSVFRTLIENVLAAYFEFKTSQTSKIRNATQSCFFPGNEDALRRVTFLYAITLFRHSRHLNALCSEAVFHCPHRYNSAGIDNDLLRSEELVRWVDELRSQRVFFDKPGGAVWMHRDVRLTLQHFLEHLDLHLPLPTKGGAEHASSEEYPLNRYLMEIRSRQHVWIGDWYQKAFCSSGHLTPIIEAVHHRVMAAIYSPFARYKQRTNQDEMVENSGLRQYRKLIFESSLVEAQKSLFMAWKSLQLWQPCPLEVSWVGAAHRAVVKRAIDDTIQKLLGIDEPQFQKLEQDRHNSDVTNDPWERRLFCARDGLLETLEALSQELLLEGGGAEVVETSGAHPMRELKNSSPRRSPLNAALTAYWQSPIKPQSTEQLCLDHGWSAVNLARKRFDDNIDLIFAGERVNGTPLLDCIRKIAHSDSSVSSKTIAALSISKGSWKSNNANYPQRLHDMIWLLGEFAYVMLRRAKLRFHGSRTVAFELWLSATIACNIGIDLCRHLPTWLIRFDMSSRVKLHTLYAVCLANIGRFFEATRHLNEAQAILSKMPDSSPADLAAIMLRRSEALLTECEWISILLQGNFQSQKSGDPRNIWSKAIQEFFGKNVAMRLIDGHPESDTWSVYSVEAVLKPTNEMRIIAVPARVAECLRKVAPTPADSISLNDNWLERAKPLLMSLYLSVLDEAVVLLDQAENNLSGNSQSSLWWSRLHTLRLRVYGLLVPLEESAADCLILRKRSADQGIFESFRNALRIARNDPFRKLRTLKYFFKADTWHRTFESKSESTRLPDSFRDAVEALVLLQKHDRLFPVDAKVVKSRDARQLQIAIENLIKTRCENDGHFKELYEKLKNC